MKYLKPSAFLIAAIWTAIMVFSLIHNNSNKRFTVTHFQETELQKEAYKVDVSPALAWDYAKGFHRTAGWIFLLVMWGAFFVVATDIYLKVFHDDKRTIGMLLIFSPLVLSVSFFFANYSSIKSNNYVNVPAAQFKQWESERKIEQKGENTWIDKSADKVLLHSFDDKAVIK